MNYLISILNLYLKKEINNPLIIELLDNENNIKIELSYTNSYKDKTYIKLKKELFFNDIKSFFDKVQDNLGIKSESFNNNIYNVTFDNDRQLNFINFSSNDLEIIRSNINHVNYELMFNNNISVAESTYDEIYKETKKVRPAFSMGFSSFITIFLTSIWFLDIFMIALWIFKAMK